MRIAQWVQSLAQKPELSQFFSSISSPVEWRSLASEARIPLIAARWINKPIPMILIVPSHDRAITAEAKLVIAGVPKEQIYHLPSGVSALFDDANPELNALSDRLGALKFLAQGDPGFVIATPGAVLERTLPLEQFQSAFFTIKKGETLDLQDFCTRIEKSGYYEAEPVQAPGQYSRRGGIIDVFASGRHLPIRIELFDDQIESIRTFDANSQRSVEQLTSITFTPSRETMYPSRSDLPAFIEMIERTMENEAAELDTEAAEQLRGLIKSDIKALNENKFFDRFDLYRPLIHSDSGCALDVLSADGMLLIDEPIECFAMAENAENDLQSALTARAERGEILKAKVTDYMLPPEHFGNFERRWVMNILDDAPESLKTKSIIEANIHGLDSYRGQGTALTVQLQTWLKQGYAVVMATDQPNRTSSMLEQIGLFVSANTSDSKDPFEPGLHLVAGNLAGGFTLEPIKSVLLTDQELFGVGRLKLPQRKFNEGVPISTVLDLVDGDYVVHINYGIGCFRGLVTRNVAGVLKEFLFIEYAAPDKLYVPADQLDRIQKYLNPGDSSPKLNRLTGGEWQRTVKKARDEAREFARDLIKLYAQRKAVQRTPFGPDTPWQSEMEQTFPYVETPSQMQAIIEAKRDLQNDYPMDRLICGDVGFGKTEVAIRAAFKAAQAGRQVVILCPTTILSEQHYRNFCDRLSSFPVKLALLNRFTHTAERNQIISDIASGEVDIVLGTHSLLSSQLKFKNLGLMIIDEEHKFGVKQKESLKQLRVNVDVMTLSATPIPRTLSMALMDIRQMSLINDPPPGRLPVRTYVRPYANEVVREAILRELARGGQVYYVYNRVQGIYHIADAIKKLIPQAKIVVGHGQMNEKELEPVMVSFIKGEADILISTTIVESGLDIPNANTLIIEDSDRMGLAQLYQLRGRVGRSDRQAYAYLFYNGNKSLTENATARLESLREFSSLGSGYNLAFRDLQIRGAGQLLGSKQHGVMATVGYELYSQLISEEVTFLKAHADGDGATRDYRDPLEGIEPLPTLDVPTQARIPEAYITDQAQRLYFYKILMCSRTDEELTKVSEEIEDRYGKRPDELKRLVWIMRLRMKAKGMRIEKIDGSGGKLSVTWYAGVEHNPRLFMLLQKQYKECYPQKGVFHWPFTGGPLAACEKMLDTLESTTNMIEEQLASLGDARSY